MTILPASLTRLGLVPAVREHLGNLQTTEGPQLRVETTLLDDSRFPSEVELAIYRVIQEAVNNARKHERASLIKVGIESSGGLLLVTVEDDGAGFDPEIPAKDRLGLLTMNERIAMLGGSLTIKSLPGAGTTVHLEVPLLPSS